jgi:hypothetical protein
MSSSKSFTNALMLSIAVLAITACVPKATEKKAICGKNEAFSTVSRSCYSIEELRAKPVGVTSAVTVSEETPQTVTLAYTDSNKDQALTCRISAIPAGLEMMPPSALDGGLNDKADEVYLAVSNLASELAVSEVAMRAALLKAKDSLYFPTKESQFGLFKTAANAILAAGAGSLNPNAQFYYTLGQQRMLVLTQKLTDLANRCECAAGICATMVIPKLNKTAATSFSYTVTDVDGDSNVKGVAVTVNPMSALSAHLAPVASSNVVSLQESNTSVPLPYSITIPTAADLTAVGSVVPLKYYFVATAGYTLPGETAKGIVTNCMNLSGSDGPTDTSCTYTPKSGNTFDTITTDLNATAVIDDLTYTSVAKGISANSFNIQYYSLKVDNLGVDPYVSEVEKFGLVSNSSEAFIRVVGNAIKVFIHPGVTSSSSIASLITAHPQASKLVTVSAGSVATFPDPSLVTPSAVYLTGGTNGFDKIPFYAQNNAGAMSTNAAAVHIRMASVDDYPILNLGVVAASAVDEDITPIIINLKTGNAYSDVDTDLVGPFNYTNVCEVTTIDTLYPGTNFTAYSCTCVLDVCSASLTPTANASGTVPFTFQYRIGSVDAATPAVTRWTDYRDYKLTINPINDEPLLTLGVIPTIAEGGSGFMDVDIAPGGSGYESTQTLTLTAASDNLTVLPLGSIVVGDLPTPVAGKKRITFTPAVNQSGTMTITYTLKDSGGVTNGGDDTLLTTFSLTVTPVNNPPVFLSNITKIETNEGGAVQSDGFEINEDVGNSSDENHQTITIDSVVSDNPSVLPNNAIKMFYDLNDNGVEDSGEARCITPIAGCTTNTLEAIAGADVKLHKLYFKLDPVDGISGNANIILTISDHIDTVADPLYLAYPATYLPLTNSVSTSFSFIVHPIAALHGGWKNISSVGIKTDKLDAPVSASEIVCNFNSTATNDAKRCNGSDCTGALSPNGTIVPDAKNVIYWDSAAKRCYRAEQALNQYSWVDFNTSCPVSKTTVPADICSGNNCIHDNVAPYPKGSVTPTAPGLYHYNTSNKTCYVSTDINNVNNWEAYVPSKVTLAWKPFIMVGSGVESSANISGWNIYRREPGTDFNFKGGHLKATGSNAVYTITDPSVMTFTDTTAIAGKVYFYVVRPVSYSMYNGSARTFPTYTPEVFSEVRVLASPANYSFVHRWIVNQEICNGMNITTATSPSKVDPTKNFRCEYTGPGESVLTPGYYDYGRDLLVDSHELGCAYAVAPKCSANGCIGIGDPVAAGLDLSDVEDDDLYYDRNSGTCYQYSGGVGGSFQSIQAAALNATALAQVNSALNAPLVNLTQTKSALVCSTRSQPTVTGVTFQATSLPSKKDYNAYASQRIDKTDAEISELELGSSLNIESRCNGSSASGLETAFIDASIPSTSFIYSLPGTFASGIKSIYTGSIPWSNNKGTEACVSRFGIQDLYGNVSEWTTDRMDCSAANHTCTSTGTASSYTAYDFDPSGGSLNYGFDNVVGPFNDTETGGVLDGPSANDADLTSWIFEYQFFTASKFSYPIGLPVSSNIIATTSVAKTSPSLQHIMDIGPSSGIPSNKLHKDGFIPNVAAVRAGATKIGAFAVGGSYLSGDMAGRFTAELVPAADARPDVGLRCIVPINNYTYTDTQHTYPY